MIYINKKNNKPYVVLAHGIDCTNQRDGTLVVIYTLENDPSNIYVREENEFYEKFVKEAK